MFHKLIEELKRLEHRLEAEFEELEIDLGLFKKKMRPTLVFNIFENNKNYNFMGVVTSLNLTSPAPVQLFMTVLDSANGNTPIAGVATLYAYAVADPTQDIAVVDPTTPADVDIHAVSNTGGTSVTPTANFVSTLLQADGVTPVFSGPITGPALVLTNNVVVAVAMAPVLAFNQ
jgi:hypothetical protein